MTTVIEPKQSDATPAGAADVTPTPTISTQTISTPTIRASLRRGRFWIGVLALLALIVIAYLALTPPSLSTLALDPSGTGQTGGKALVQVLSQHGVTVTPTTSLAATRHAITDKADTTVFVYDPSHYLDSDQLSGLSILAANVVVLSPGKTAVASIDSNISLIGDSARTLTAHCSSTAATNAASITDGGHAYRVAATATGYTTCFPSYDNDYTLIQTSNSGSKLSVVGATHAFENRYIPDAGNAALALNLLGARSHLVWYLPSLEDVDAGGQTVSLAQAAPAWIPGFTVLVLLVVVAAAIWRGRRFGPLVVEQMPVTVRAGETMEGRARLYQASSSRVRALDSLRVGAIRRIALLTGLPRTADVDQVAAAVATTTGRPLALVRGLLVETLPSSDADLVRLSDELLRLERDVQTATHPS